MEMEINNIRTLQSQTQMERNAIFLEPLKPEEASER
jgi:hypothetical protein